VAKANPDQSGVRFLGALNILGYQSEPLGRFD